ncbi:unnamed protein product [Musa acuminata subsp. malaccensis]|uniref:(wild Malaysian banana) hypothetical protein n=1 Tax=Musa acuminata subsp. malaccensis TaxID=214687 RepID=A0A804K1R0_MUSAM|nr:PREDICTED: abnormal long morphology protein 1-like isoform X1 [Musa acuminata subsp. malaccensis]CAG1830275.1 unnamed protein product [Musa acuminata subsp. malaccensis]
MPTSAAADGLPRSLPSKALPSPPDSGLRQARKPHPGCRVRNREFRGAAVRTGLRNGGTAAGGRRSGPGTPFLRWKLQEAPPPKPVNEVGDVRPGAGPPRMSARKLVAGIWHLQPLRDGNGSRRPPPGLESVPQHQRDRLLCNPLGADLHANKNKKNGSVGPVSVLSPKYGNVLKLAGFPNSVTENATKWDPESSMTSEEVFRFYGQLKLLEAQELNTDTLVNSLRTELERARARIIELETERRSAKKELDRFLRRVAEEKASWRSREHEKVRAMIEATKADLHRERKKRQKAEIVRARLIDELAEAKLTAKQLLRDCGKERRARELVEEVCDELAKEIGEDKAEIGTLKMEALKIREEAEDDKKMLQMAEVWREERVQMKLIEAKLILEEKYSQLRELRAELEAFLSTSAAAHSDFASVREAELLKEQVDLANTEGMEEFSYQPPPASEDIHAVFEELQPNQETHERDIEPCSGRSPESHDTASPETDAFLEHPPEQNAHESVDSKDDVEDDSDREKVSHAEERGSSNSHVGIEPSVDDCCKESYASVSETESKENRQDKVNQETIEVSSANAKSRKVMASSMCKLWRSSAHDIVDDLLRTSDEVKPGRLSNGSLASYHDEVCEKLSIEHTTGRLSNGNKVSDDTLSPGIGPGGAGSSPAKGCTERPRSNQRHSLKAKLMEARMGSQKIQLRHVLKQKM